MLIERLARQDVPVWLVNTGWTGGPYGTGERMNIAHTRSMVRAALDGALDGVADAGRPELRGRGPADAARTCRRRSSTRARRGRTRTPTTGRRSDLGGDVRRELRGLRRRRDRRRSGRPGRLVRDPTRQTALGRRAPAEPAARRARTRLTIVTACRSTTTGARRRRAGSPTTSGQRSGRTDSDGDRSCRGARVRRRSGRPGPGDRSGRTDDDHADGQGPINPMVWRPVSRPRGA